MSDIEQSPFTFSESTENPEPRCACLLLLDTSGSMGGAPIRELNAGLQAFKEALSQDTLAMKRVEIAIVTSVRSGSSPISRPSTAGSRRT